MPRLPRRLVLLAVLAGCAPRLPPEPVEVPGIARAMYGEDPTIDMIAGAHRFFANPPGMRGNPAAGALGLAQLEYLAAVMAVGGARHDMAIDSAGPLRAGRAEARAVAGLRADASPQQAVDSLFAAYEA
uniref:hypothetical protein n=1 Tax=Falsiroseomonas oryzae TaxID=2766473 RepID=UPI0038CC16BF